MAQKLAVDVRVFEGPNLHAPWPAVVAEFPGGMRPETPADRVAAAAAEVLPGEFVARLPGKWSDGRFEAVPATLANAIQDLAGPCDLPVESRREDPGRARILLGFHDSEVAVVSIQAGLNLALAVCDRAAGGSPDVGALFSYLQGIEPFVRARQPDFIARSLLRVARRRGIPVLPVCPGTRIWQYGHGRAGIKFFEAANQRDSAVGQRLAMDKGICNRLLTRLGFPGVVHRAVLEEADAVKAARDIGFPVVVKPAQGSKGRGVTTGMSSDEDVVRAFAAARAAHPGPVLVEGQVPGDDHRLTVVGGRFTWAARRSPPRVTGDGEHTVEELIEMENRNRSDADVAAGFVVRLVADEDMRALLGRQGYALGDRPPEGRTVRLRGIANTATGATITNCTEQVHPDVCDMAESIARGFHLDTVGIDFITPEIGASWRDARCAVLEVNVTPGLSSDERAERILAGNFPAGADGRIPSVVVVGDDGRLPGRIEERLEAAGLTVGWTDASATRVGGRPRFRAATALPSRVTGLLLDPACAALVVSVVPEEIERHGFPLDRCDVAVVAAGVALAKPLAGLLDRCAATVIDPATDDDVDGQVIPRLVAG